MRTLRAARGLSRLRTGLFTAGRWVVVAVPPGKEHARARFVQRPLPAAQFLQLIVSKLNLNQKIVNKQDRVLFLPAGEIRFTPVGF